MSKKTTHFKNKQKYFNRHFTKDTPIGTRKNHQRTAKPQCDTNDLPEWQKFLKRKIPKFVEQQEYWCQECKMI